MSFSEKKKYLNAQIHYKTAYEQDPAQSAVAALRAAHCFWKLHQKEIAIEWAQKAVSSDPQWMGILCGASGLPCPKVSF